MGNVTYFPGNLKLQNHCQAAYISGATGPARQLDSNPGRRRAQIGWPHSACKGVLSDSQMHCILKMNATVRNRDTSQNSSEDPATVGLHPSTLSPQSGKVGPVLAQLSHLPHLTILATLALPLPQIKHTWGSFSPHTSCGT